MSAPVRIPANVDLEDRVLARLTARQLIILGATAAGLYLAWLATHDLIPIGVFLVAAIPFGGAAAALAVGRRDGISFDRFVVAAARHVATTRAPRLTPDRAASSGPRDSALRGGALPGGAAVPGWLVAPTEPILTGAGGLRHPIRPAPLPVCGVTTRHATAATGVVDLGRDGLAVLAVCSTVSFALRTPTEQDTLTATFGRYLHSLTAPIQLLIRALPLDLQPQITALRAAAPQLPHPALAAAATDHAGFLAELEEQHDLLRRQVVLVFREPHPTPPSTRGRTTPGQRRQRGQRDEARRAAVVAETRLARRLAEATELLAPAGIVVVGLDADRAAAVLAAACHPGRLLPLTAWSDPDDITTGW